MNVALLSKIGLLEHKHCATTTVGLITETLPTDGR